jgi:hypothetical protein
MFAPTAQIRFRELDRVGICSGRKKVFADRNP